MNKERFNNVVMYSLAEPGAMGWGGYMKFVTDDGNYFTINYLSEETPWEDVKKCFPELKGCCFNGPMENEKTSGEILLYLLLDESTTRALYEHYKTPILRHLQMPNLISMSSP